VQDTAAPIAALQARYHEAQQDRADRLAAGLVALADSAHPGT